MKANEPDLCGKAADRSTINKKGFNQRDDPKEKTTSHKKVVAAKLGRSKFFKIHKELEPYRMARETRRTLAEDLLFSLHYMNNDRETRHSPAHSPHRYQLPVNLLDLYLKYSYHPQNTLRQEFQELRQCRPLLPTTAALTPTNIPKNRSLHVLPGDQYRCVLRPVAQRARQGTPLRDILHQALREDYINATIVNTGYHEVIATPHPLPCTVQDFWRMVVQTRASAVVMFQATQADLSEFPRYWPMMGEECSFLGNTKSPIVITREPPGPTTPSRATKGVAKRTQNDSKDRETGIADDINLLKTAWRKEKNDSKLVMISGKRAREYEGDKVQRLHRHTKRLLTKCAAERRDAGEKGKDLKHQLGRGRETDGRRVQAKNEEKYETQTKRRAVTHAELKESCGNDRQVEKGREKPLGDSDREKEHDVRKVEHYQWRGEMERQMVEQVQKSPHYYLSYLYLWMGSRSGSRRRLIPHFHFPGGLQDAGAMLHLLQAVLYNQDVVRGPIVVHCPDGADLSGVFVVLARLVQQEVNRRRDEDEKAEIEKEGIKKTEENEEQEGGTKQKGCSINVYEALNHVRQYFPCAVRHVTSYRFLYHCLHTFITSPLDMFGYWVVRRPLLDSKLTALRPYSTKSLLSRVEKEYPDLLQATREAYLQDTRQGRSLRRALFQEVIKRVKREMRGECRVKNKAEGRKRNK